MATANVHKAAQRRSKVASEVVNVSHDCIDILDSGELLSGTPTVTELVTSDFAFANVAISTAEKTINGRTVAIAQAVTFKVSGGTAGTMPTCKIVVKTDASPPATRVQFLDIIVNADS